MIENGEVAVNGRKPVHFYGRCGGVVPGGHELLEQYQRILEGRQS